MSLPLGSTIHSWPAEPALSVGQVIGIGPAYPHELAERQRLLKEDALAKQLLSMTTAYMTVSSQPGGNSMTNTVQTATFNTLSLDALFTLDALTDLVTAKYGVYRLPTPDWLSKRSRELQRAIVTALEKEVEAAEAELKSLEEKETKRQTARDRIAQLKKALE